MIGRTYKTLIHMSTLSMPIYTCFVIKISRLLHLNICKTTFRLARDVNKFRNNSDIASSVSIASDCFTRHALFNDRSQNTCS